MKKFNQLISANLAILIIMSAALYYTGIVELNILLFIYLPFIGLAIYRQRNNKEIKNIYKFFRIYTWLLILLFGTFLVWNLIELRDSFFYYGFISPFSYFVEGIWHRMPLTTIIIMLFALLKTNSYLVPIAKSKKIDINKKMIFVLLVIAVMAILSYFAWDYAYVLEGQIIDIYGWENPEITNMERTLAFDITYKEISLYNGFVFLSTFLILYTWKKN